MTSPVPLLFAPTQLHVDATFWHEVEQRKLHSWKLNTPIVDLAATIRSPLFTVAGYRGDNADLVSNVIVDNHSFRGCFNEDRKFDIKNKDQIQPVDHSFVPASKEDLAKPNNAPTSIRNCSVRVDFFNCNLVEEYKVLDKKTQLAFAEQEVVARAVKEDKIGSIPLTRGYIFAFADLKAHTFQFTTAMPVCDLPSAVAPRPNIISSKSVEQFCESKNIKNAAGWWKNLVNYAGSLAETNPAWNGGDSETDTVLRLRIVPFLVPIRDAGSTDELNGGIVPLTNADLLSKVNAGTHAVAMIDAGNSNPDYPGWVWRNVVTAMRLACPKLTDFNLVALRSASSGVVFECKCDPIAADIATVEVAVAGWHKGSQTVDLSDQMDPVKLADSSANLNMQLMKWRMLPSLDLDALMNTKALLLGSGTLGCNIARHLVMWGVRHITMLDRGNVSHSNPVRQTLFEHADVLKTGEDRIKSIAACNALKRILPTVNATGVNLEIRMPGHRIDENMQQQAAKDIEKLRELILAHDVIFLLTDSRESRWLPTLLSIAHNKPVINAALAFDSYLVLRHGLHTQGPQQVGCYFCNDVVAPIDSLSARSLDQQCTVTRPGVSAMASALAVELLSTLLNHPKRFNCPAWIDEDSPAFDEKIDSPEYECTTVLGIVPHQLRGNISTSYACNVLHGRAFSKCTACSEAVVRAYKAGGVPWLIKVINDPSLLETVSGLEEDRKALDDLGDGADCDFDDEDDE